MEKFRDEWSDEWKHKRRIIYLKDRIANNLIFLWNHNAIFEKVEDEWQKALEIYHIDILKKQIRKDLKEIEHRRILCEKA